MGKYTKQLPDTNSIQVDTNKEIGDWTVTYVHTNGKCAVHTVTKEGPTGDTKVSIKGNAVKVEWCEEDGITVKDEKSIPKYTKTGASDPCDEWTTRQNTYENAVENKEGITKFNDETEFDENLIVYSLPCGNDNIDKDYNLINHYFVKIRPHGGEEIVSNPKKGPYCPIEMKRYGLNKINVLLKDFNSSKDKDTYVDDILEKHLCNLYDTGRLKELINIVKQTPSGTLLEGDEKYVSKQRRNVLWYLYSDSDRALDARREETKKSDTTSKDNYTKMKDCIKEQKERPLLLDSEVPKKKVNNVEQDACDKGYGFGSYQKQMIYQENWIRHGKIGTLMSVAKFQLHDKEHDEMAKFNNDLENPPPVKAQYTVAKRGEQGRFKVVQINKWTEGLERLKFSTTTKDGDGNIKKKKNFANKYDAYRLVRIYKSDDKKDVMGKKLVLPGRSKSGSLMLVANAAEVDHCHPENYAGEPKGSNSYCNARLASSIQNNSDNNSLK